MASSSPLPDGLLEIESGEDSDDKDHVDDDSEMIDDWVSV